MGSCYCLTVIYYVIALPVLMKAMQMLIYQSRTHVQSAGINDLGALRNLILHTRDPVSVNNQIGPEDTFRKYKFSVCNCKHFYYPLLSALIDRRLGAVLWFLSVLP